MVETYDATRPRPVEAEMQSKIWTAIIITSLAAGITGAVVRHIFDPGVPAATRPGDTTTAPINGTTGAPMTAPPDTRTAPGADPTYPGTRTPSPAP